MKRNKLVFLFGAVGIGAYLLFRQVRKDIFGLNYSIVGVTNASVTGGITVTLNVRVSNPGVTPFPMYNTTVKGTLGMNNSISFGTAIGYLNQIIAPGSSVTIPVQVTVNPNIFSGGIASLLLALSTPGVLFTFVGEIIVSGASSPLNLSYKVL